MGLDRAVGVFHHQKSEGLEGYLAAMGVPWLAKKMITNTSPTVEVAREGEDWTITFKLPIKTNKVAFKIGQEFSESSPLDDKPHKCLATIVEDSLVITAETEKGPTTRTFHFTEDGMVIHMHAVEKKAEAKRIFKRDT